jgi:actinin alpha
MTNVDPTQTGFVTFESFLDFMTRECSEEDNVDQLILAFKTLSADKVSQFIFSSYYSLIIV